MVMNSEGVPVPFSEFLKDREAQQAALAIQPNPGKTNQTNFVSCIITIGDSHPFGSGAFHFIPNYSKLVGNQFKAMSVSSIILILVCYYITPHTNFNVLLPILFVQL